MSCRIPLHVEFLHRLRDLVAARDCAGCGGPAPVGLPLCAGCHAVLRDLAPVAGDAVGVDAHAAGSYSAVLRECVLSFKERHRRDMTKPLSRLLARVAADHLTPGTWWFVPIPATRRAVRQRGFDHVALLSRRLADMAPRARVAAVLRAAPRPDSTQLNRQGRHLAAAASLRVRPKAAAALRGLLRARPAGRVVLVDDVVTSGATLNAAAAALSKVGVPVADAVTLAATSRRFHRNHQPFSDDIQRLKR